MLSWNFEQFREYLDYRVLMGAAAVLLLFEGESTSANNPKISQIHALLEQRTRKNTWVPARSGTQGIAFNEEGSFYRNKKRVLTSMFIVEDTEAICLLPFGRALAMGKVSEEQFYDFILTHFRYPHPGYEDNWTAWTAAGQCLNPFVFLLEVLVALHERMPQRIAFLSAREVLFHLHPSSDHKDISKLAEAIITERQSQQVQTPPREQTLTREQVSTLRNINDIFGFLAKSGYAFYLNDSTIGLNLTGKHPTEHTHYWGSRRPSGQSLENRLDDVKKLIAAGLHNITSKGISL